MYFFVIVVIHIQLIIQLDVFNIHKIIFLKQKCLAKCRAFFIC